MHYVKVSFDFFASTLGGALVRCSCLAGQRSVEHLSQNVRPLSDPCQNPKASRGPGEGPGRAWMNPNSEMCEKLNVFQWFWRPPKVKVRQRVCSGRRPGKCPKALEPPTTETAVTLWRPARRTPGGSADSEGLRPLPPTPGDYHLEDS